MFATRALLYGVCLLLVSSATVDAASLLMPEWRYAGPYPNGRNSCASDPECPRGWICGTGGMCVALAGIRFVEDHVWDPVAIGLILGVGLPFTWLGCGLYWNLATHRCRADGPGQRRTHAVLFGAPFMGLWLFVFLGLWQIQGEVDRVETDVSTYGNARGNPCVTPWDLACGQYQCDLTVGRCFTECHADNECAPPSTCGGITLAEDAAWRRGDFHPSGSCRFPFDKNGNTMQLMARPTLAYPATYFGLMVAGLALSALFALLARIRARVSWLEAMVLGAVFGTVTFALLIIMVGAIGSRLRIDTPSNTPVPGESNDANDAALVGGVSVPCLTHAECTPYLCEPRSSTCSIGCIRTESSSCQAGYHCVDKDTLLYESYEGIGVCTPIDGFVAYQPLPPQSAAAFGMLGAIVLFLLGEAILRCTCRGELLPRAATVLLTAAIFCAIFFDLRTLHEVAMPSDAALLSDVPCAAPTAVVCEPYLCNVAYNVTAAAVHESGSGRCLRACSMDAHCMLSTVCREGQCVAEHNPNGRGTAVPYIPLTLVVVLCLFLGAAIFVSCMLLLRCMVRREAGPQAPGVECLPAMVTACVPRFFCILFLIIVMIYIIGLLLALPTDTILVPPEDRLPTDNRTSCVGARASACYPHFCDIDSGMCFDGCHGNAHCWEDALCLNVDPDTDAALASSAMRCFAMPGATWSRGPRAAALIVGVGGLMFGFMLVMVGCTWNHCRFTGAPCYDQLRLHRLLLLLGFALPVAFAFGGGMALLALDMPGPFCPHGNATGVTCSVPLAFQCDPYYCDTRSSRCYEACSENQDCRYPFICSDNECIQGDDGKGIGALSAVVVIFAAVIVVANPGWCVEWHRARSGDAPQTHETQRERWRRAREEDVARERAYNEEQEALARQVELAKKEHPIMLDILPPFPDGPDPSLPSPTAELHRAPPVPADNHAALSKETSASEDEAGFPAVEPRFCRTCGASVLRELSCAACAGEADKTQDRNTTDPKDVAQIRPAPILSPLSTPKSPIIALKDDTLAPRHFFGAVPSPLPPRALPPINSKPERGDCVRSPSLASVPAAAAAAAVAVDCGICFSAPATVRLAGSNCSHVYCGACASQTLSSIYSESQFPARCPGCRADQPDPPSGAVASVPAPVAVAVARSHIPAQIIERLAARAVLAADFARRFIHAQLLHAFEPSTSLACPVCSILLSAPNLNAKPALVNHSHLKATCPECTMSFCAKCMGMWHAHADMDCETFALLKRRHDDEAKSAAEIARVAKQCPNCGMGTIHYRGHACHHVGARDGCANCHYNFCCVCLQPWPCHDLSHGPNCDARCDCPTCPDCKPGHPCPFCPGPALGCPSCNGRPAPSSSDL